MIVYVASSESVDGGGDVFGVFSDPEIAKDAINKLNDWDSDWKRLDWQGSDTDGWVKTSNDLDFYQVDPFEIDTRISEESSNE